MKEKISCPKCETSFYSKEQLKESVKGPISFFRQISKQRMQPLFSKGNNILDSSNITICPKCGYEFIDEKIRYFGIFSLPVLKMLLIFFIVILFIAFPMYILIKDIMK